MNWLCQACHATRDCAVHVDFTEDAPGVALGTCYECDQVTWTVNCRRPLRVEAVRVP